MRNVVNVHSYINSKPVHGITWRGTTMNASARDNTAAKKQKQIETAPK